MSTALSRVEYSGEKSLPRFSGGSSSPKMRGFSQRDLCFQKGNQCMLKSNSMILPELFYKHDTLHKLTKRMQKVVANYQLHRSYISELMANKAALQQELLQAVAQLRLQSLAVIGKNPEVSNFVGLVKHISNFVKLYCQLVLGRVNSLPVLEGSKLVSEVSGRIDSFLELALRYKKLQDQNNNLQGKYKQLIGQLDAEVRQYFCLLKDPLLAFNVNRLQTAKQRLSQKNKNLINFEITLKHDYERLSVRNHQLNGQMTRQRQILIESVAQTLSSVLQLGKSAFDPERPKQFVIEENARDDSAACYQLFNTSYCDLRSSVITRSHLSLPQNVESSIRFVIQKVGSSIRSKNRLAEFVLDVRNKVKGSLKQMRSAEDSLFGPNKINKFQKNIKKYYGDTYFKFYTRAVNNLHSPARLAQAFIVTFTQAFTRIKQYTQTFAASANVSLNDLHHHLEGLKKVRDIYQKGSKAQSQAILLNKGYDKHMAAIKAVCSELQIKQDFNLRIIGDSLRESTLKLFAQYKREIQHLLRAKSSDDIRPQREAEAALRLDSKKSLICFNSYFDNHMPNARFEESKVFEETLRQIFAAINITTNSAIESSISCFKTRTKYLKCYSCSLQDTIQLIGKLYVSSAGLTFESSFNSRNLFFESTVLAIPKQQIKDTQKSQQSFAAGRLTIVTTRGSIDFVSFYKNYKADKFIRNEFKLDVLQQQAQPVKAEESPAYPTRQNMGCSVSHDQLNFSVWASLITKEGNQFDTVKQSDTYSIQVPSDWTLFDCVTKLMQNHKSYLEEKGLLINCEQKNQYYQFYLSIDSHTFVVRSQSQFLDKGPNSGLLKIRACSHISKGKVQEQFRDTLEIGLAFVTGRLSFWFEKDNKHVLFTYYENIMLQELRNFYAGMLEQLQFKFKTQPIIPKQLTRVEETSGREVSPVLLLLVLALAALLLAAAC